MVAPQREANIDEWIELFQKLSPVEKLAVIGLLFLRPHTPLSIIAPSVVNDEKNISAFEKWAMINFRKAFSFFCENYGKHRFKMSTQLVKQLGPLLVSSHSLPLGIAVGFLLWAADYGLKNWCDKYGARNFTGDGKYMGDLPGSPDWPDGEVRAYFNVKYLPPITEIVENPESYPLKGYKVIIKIQAETSGLIKVSSSPEVDAIVLSFKGEGSQSFSFIDTRTEKTVSGDVANVFPRRDDGPNVLGFIAAEIETN